ncbi:hypothetical protein BDC45DRAFT_553469 [Circinella umbellata]|nr:hypothetical protein BDC45DRAFT_540445 [Circinella umbellata]KAI7859733.1 hypothetical protein BDC45DRAFT_553469 [Circinella umbellata]
MSCIVINDRAPPQPAVALVSEEQVSTSLAFTNININFDDIKYESGEDYMDSTEYYSTENNSDDSEEEVEDDDNDDDDNGDSVEDSESPGPHVSEVTAASSPGTISSTSPLSTHMALLQCGYIHSASVNNRFYYVPIGFVPHDIDLGETANL